MRHLQFSILCLLAGYLTLARGQDTKPNLSGNWQLNTAKSELRSGKAAAIGLAIEQKGSSIHVIKTAKATDGKEMKTEFRCTTDGKECLVDGTKISLWYDGAVLVELDVGSEVVSKSSMKLGTDGKSMSVDVVYIVPQGDGDKLVLEKI